MKSLVNRVVMLAASAMVLGTFAYGQTEMKAKIPFAFHTSNGAYPAGEYTFGQQSVNGGSAIATLRNNETLHKVFVSGGVKDTWNAGSPAVVFRCSGEDGCMLSAIRNTGSAIAYNTSRKSMQEKQTAMVVVPLRAANAD